MGGARQEERPRVVIDEAHTNFMVNLMKLYERVEDLPKHVWMLTATPSSIRRHSTISSLHHQEQGGRDATGHEARGRQERLHQRVQEDHHRQDEVNKELFYIEMPDKVGMVYNHLCHLDTYNDSDTVEKRTRLRRKLLIDNFVTGRHCPGSTSSYTTKASRTW